jgi:hypothetical protein
MFLILAMFVAIGVYAVPKQGAGMEGKAAASQNVPKEDRVSGTIIRSNKEKSTLIVREGTSKIERTVTYDATTKWTKAKGVAVDMKEFKDGDRVICLGKLDEKGVLAATRIDLQTK